MEVSNIAILIQVCLTYVKIFQPTDVLTETDALTALKSLLDCLHSDGIPAPDSHIQGIAEIICTECLHILEEPERSQALPAIKVVDTMLRGPCKMQRTILL